jgi:hypothetical protein
MMGAVQWAASAAALLLLAGPASAATTFLAANLDVEPSVELRAPVVDAQDFASDSDMDFADQNGTLADLSVATRHLTAQLQSGENLLAEIASDEAMGLTFTDAANGQFTVDALSVGTNYIADVLNHGPHYYYGVYGFSVDRASQLDLSFTDGFGAIRVYSQSIGHDLFTSAIPASGGASVALTAGEYALILQGPNMDTLRFSGVGTERFERHTVVGFQISDASVPEPSVWAVMISGFGLAGSILRRRKAFATAARRI